MSKTLPEIPENQLPGEFHLYQNDPNPFGRSTTIRFAVPKKCHVRLVLHNSERELVCVLHDGPVSAGHYSMVWDGAATDGKRLGNGFYTYTLEANGFVATRKMEISSKSQAPNHN